MSVEESVREDMSAVEFEKMKNRHNKIMSKLEKHYSEDALSWISLYDARNVWDFYQADSVNEYEKIADDEYGSNEGSTLILPNKRLAVLWAEEIGGQISDGAWENDDRLSAYGRGEEKWPYYTFADIEIQPNATPKIEAPTRVPKLNFLDELTSYEGNRARMIYYIRMSGLDSNYGPKDLQEDLKRLDKMNRNVI